MCHCLSFPFDVYFSFSAIPANGERSFHKVKGNKLESPEFNSLNSLLSELKKFVPGEKSNWSYRS